MIKGSCFTNLDGYEMTRWPSVFVAVPRKGERVEGRSSGGRTATRPTLYVVNITHCERDGEPYIVVELHRRGS